MAISRLRDKFYVDTNFINMASTSKRSLIHMLYNHFSREIELFNKEHGGLMVHTSNNRDEKISILHEKRKEKGVGKVKRRLSEVKRV